MRFLADLHVHSKYSRATSRDLDLEHLSFWAGLKGIAVVATGDFTHPAWRAELKEKLVPAEPGLFRLRDEIERGIAERLPPACRQPVRFMLSVEISTIYKKGERTRKIHHLIYAPDFAAAERIVARLVRIGNLASDGRPILGLDSRHLLEITLESSPDSYLVPAHIWTPWFAVLGSQSGFDSIEECYGDLAPHIFAVETGLSSDPPMNWRVSFLDRYRLTSNSDAHSPGKLGREATVFAGERDYFAIRRALETGEGYAGTVEFFPEEGKYHLDGHRRCGIRLAPRETLDRGGRCPVCGEPVTVGVLHRVERLADRSEEEAAPPPTAGPVANLVPLQEILAEITSRGAGSKAVARNYDRLIASVGPELAILDSIPLEDLARAGSSLLAEAIDRLRAGRVIREAGYDGAYGVIRLFEKAELDRHTKGGLLFEMPPPPAKTQKTAVPSAPIAGLVEARPRQSGESRGNEAAGGIGQGSSHAGAGEGAGGVLAALDADQRAAAGCVDGPVLIAAGPGSGKTRTLTHRIAHLILEHDAAPGACLAVTFTRRAAKEMRDRLASLVPEQADAIPIHTFHSLGLSILREHPDAAGLPPDFRIATEAERTRWLAEALAVSERKAGRLLTAISKAKRANLQPDEAVAEAAGAYARALAGRGAVDFDDLVGGAVQILAADPTLTTRYRDRFRWIAVDEFQDLDAQQYRLVTLLAPPQGNVCVVGDLNQAIYGFRGADAAVFARFHQDYPQAALFTLRRNYRSSGTIVTAASQVIVRGGDGGCPPDSIAEAMRGMLERITTHTAATERAEAEFVVATIEQAIGGVGFFSLDSGRATGRGETGLAFSDFAILYRTGAQAAALVEALARSGIPFKKHAHGPLSEKPAVRALMRELDCLAGEGHGRALPALLGAAAERIGGGEEALDAAAIEMAFQQLTALAEACEDDQVRLAEAVALTSDADFWDPRADRVSLLTLHAAKGLEFPVVFIVGLEDGLLPLKWGQADAGDGAEERRLFYVGMTRAKDRLFLSRAEERRWRGGRRRLAPSPFLGDIEAALLEQRRAEARRRTPQARQLELF